MKIKTNANDIIKGKEILIVGRSKVMQSRRVVTLKETLDAIQSEFDKLDFEPVEMEVEEREFERLDVSRPAEVALFTGSDIIRPQAVEAKSDPYRNPRF